MSRFLVLCFDEYQLTKNHHTKFDYNETQQIDPQHTKKCHTQHNDIYHNGTPLCYAECRK
jgi:hypothetical protein